MITIFKAIYKSVNSRQKSPLQIVFYWHVIITHTSGIEWQFQCVYDVHRAHQNNFCVHHFEYLPTSPVENILKPFRYNELFLGIETQAIPLLQLHSRHSSATFSPLCLFWASSNQCSIVLEVHQSHRTCGFVFLCLMYFSGSSMLLMIWSIFFTINLSLTILFSHFLN